MYMALLFTIVIQLSLSISFATESNSSSISLTHDHDSHIAHHLRLDAKTALTFISDIQNSCEKNEYILVKSGINGGFSAQFQLIASRFMLSLAAGDFQIPVLVSGPFNGYSNAPECKDADYQWLCYFEATSQCHERLLKDGKEIKVKSNMAFEEAIPDMFRKFGYPFWWGVVQQFLFRFKPFVHEHIQVTRNHFPLHLPVVGIHVRNGDKKFDGFSTHSLTEELSIFRKSILCPIQNSRGDCFLPVSTSGNHTKVVAQSKQEIIPLYEISSVLLHAKQSNIKIIPREDVGCWNASIGHCINQNNSHSNLPGMHSNHVKHFPSARFHRLSSIIIGPNKTLSTDEFSFVIPSQVFVASDDSEVLLSARNIYGFRTGSVGVSQQVSEKIGMVHTLLKEPSLSFQATKEIISDIYYLSRCQILIGSASSQVFRVAAAMANLSHKFISANIVDVNDVPRVKAMSEKYHIPFPEHFV